MIKKTAFVLAAFATLAACTQDNVHAPEAEIRYVDREVPGAQEQFDDSLYYRGTITNSVPSMASLMDPVTTADDMQFKNMTGKTSGYATIVLGAFDISVAAMGMNISIGEMVIDSVQYAFYPNGNGMFVKDNFEVMAGQYNTVGSLSGTFDAATGTVTMTMDYKPGSMPFTCHGELTATNQ